MPSTFKEQIRIVPGGFAETIASLEKLVPDLKIAVVDTVNKSIEFVQKDAVELILKRYNISSAALMNPTSRHGKWKFVVQKATDSNLTGKVQVVGTRMPVMRFSVSPSSVPNQLGIPVANRTPVKIRIVKRGRAQIGAPNVFLAKMKTGHVGVYRRKYPNPGGPRRTRSDGQKTQLPITEEYMLSVPEMLAGKQLRAKLDKNLDKFVGDTLKAELKQVSGKAWARVKRVITGGGSKI